MSQTNSPDKSPVRIALAVEYDGSRYCGWQKQNSPKLATVQATLESALSQVANESVSTVCAGRTDTGVHATCQVIHFDSEIDRGNRAWTRGVNSLLPDSIRVIWGKQVDSDFHARFSATARRYVYVIYCDNPASALFARRLSHVRQMLDTDAMNKAAQHLVGEQDFSTFRAAGCQSKTPMREVFEANVIAQGKLCYLDIRANAFLQHMVRNICGALISVGRGEEAPEWINELLLARERTKAGTAAVPDGLYLVQVDYPENFRLPPTCRMPLLLDSGADSV